MTTDREPQETDADTRIAEMYESMRRSVARRREQYLASLAPDKSAARILWAVAIIGCLISIPIAAVVMIRDGVSLLALLLPLGGAVLTYCVVAAPFFLYGVGFILGRVIKLAFFGLMPQEGDPLLSWPLSFKRAGFLIISSVVLFAVVFLLITGGGHRMWLD